MLFVNDSERRRGLYVTYSMNVPVSNCLDKVFGDREPVRRFQLPEGKKDITFDLTWYSTEDSHESIELIGCHINTEEGYETQVV